MMGLKEKRKLKFASADSKTWIHVLMWIPEGKVRGVIQVSHGFTEYADRYEEFAEFFIEHGFVVVVHDQLGHGMSYKATSDKMFFDCWQYLVSDFKTVYTMVKHEFKDVPYFVLGFSMGSFVVREFVFGHSHKLAGTILIGTGYQPKAVTSLMRKLVNSHGKKHGFNKPSDFVKKLMFGPYNKLDEKPKTDFDWLCKDKATLADYMADTKIGKFVTAGLFRELLQGIENTCNVENTRGMSRYMPILLMSGSDDPVGDKTKGVKKLAKILRDEAMKDVTDYFYPGARHDLLREGSVKVKVYHDLLTWIEARM